MPLVSADLISKQTKTDSKAEELFKMFMELKSTVAQHKVALDKVTSQTTSHDETMAPMKTTFANIESAVRQAKQEVKEVQEEMKRKHVPKSVSSHTVMSLGNGILKTSVQSSGISSMAVKTTANTFECFLFPTGQRWTFGSISN